MNLRNLTVFALVLASVAIVAWVWLARDRPPAAILAAPEAAQSPATVENLPAGKVPDSKSSPVREAAPAEPQALPTKPAEPVQMTSSVAPGMPLVRTLPAPPRPPGGAVGASAGGRASRPEPQAEAKADLEGVLFMLRDFRTRMGENPVGSNAEIMRSVMGGNEAKARLGPPPGQSVNAEGELVDRWGTPYFFHQLSKTSMEIRSAGPDGKLWTADDLVTK